MERVEARRLDRCAQLAVVAALEAWQDAGYGLGEDNPVDRERLGVAIATGIGGMMTLLTNWDVQKEKGVAPGQPAGDPDADGQRLGSQREPAARRPGWSTRPRVGLCARATSRSRLAWTCCGWDAPTSPWSAGRRVSSTRCRSPLRPDAGHPPQRRAGACVAAVGRRPGRLRARRGCRVLGHRDPGARAGPRRPYLRRARRSRHHRRCPRHGPAGPSGAVRPRP